jgi:hypothetical protein
MRFWLLVNVVAALALSACGGRLVKKQYEYEEEMYLALDGSATLNVNASVPALVALRGMDLNPSPRAIRSRPDPSVLRRSRRHRHGAELITPIRPQVRPRQHAGRRRARR